MIQTRVFVQPPPRVELGAPLRPPIVVVLSAPAGTHTDNLFAIAHVCDGDVDEEDAGASPNVLSGTKIVNGHIGKQFGADNKEVWLFSWRDLAFTIAGSFSLQIHVFEADVTGARFVSSVKTRGTVVKERPVLEGAASPEKKRPLEMAETWESRPQTFRI